MHFRVSNSSVMNSTSYNEKDINKNFAGIYIRKDIFQSSDAVLMNYSNSFSSPNFSADKRANDRRISFAHPKDDGLTTLSSSSEKLTSSSNKKISLETYRSRLTDGPRALKLSSTSDPLSSNVIDLTSNGDSPPQRDIAGFYMKSNVSNKAGNNSRSHYPQNFIENRNIPMENGNIPRERTRQMVMESLSKQLREDRGRLDKMLMEKTNLCVPISILSQKKTEIESQLQELTSKKANIEKEIEELKTTVAEGEKAIRSMEEFERGPGRQENFYQDSSSYSESFLDSSKTREYMRQGMKSSGPKRSDIGMNQTFDSQWQWSKGQKTILRKRRNKKNKEIIECEVCNVTFSMKGSSSHLKGKKHATRIALLQAKGFGPFYMPPKFRW